MQTGGANPVSGVRTELHQRASRSERLGQKRLVIQLVSGPPGRPRALLRGWGCALRGGLVDVVIYATAFQACRAGRKWQAALHLLGEMPKLRVELDLGHVGSLWWYRTFACLVVAHVGNTQQLGVEQGSGASACLHCPSWLNLRDELEV